MAIALLADVPSKYIPQAPEAPHAGSVILCGGDLDDGIKTMSFGCLPPASPGTSIHTGWTSIGMPLHSPVIYDALEWRRNNRLTSPSREFIW